MNISASNQSLENIIIRQVKEKKRPSFASVFEKINKRTANMNRITPLNNQLTNEQLWRYYLKETDPKLQVSDDVLGEDETTLADLITNKSLNMSQVNQTTDEGDDDDKGKVDKSQSFVDRSSFLKPNNVLESLENLNNSQLELKNYLEKMNFETFVNDEYNDSINPMYQGSPNDFVSSIVGNITDNLQRKEDNLQNSLMEAGVDAGPIKYYDDWATEKFTPFNTLDKASSTINSSIKGYLARKKAKALQNLTDYTAGVDFKETDISPIKTRTRTLKPKKNTYITADQRPTYNIMMRAVEERALAEYEARSISNPLSGAAITKRGRPIGSKNKSKDTEGFV